MRQPWCWTTRSHLELILSQRLQAVYLYQTLTELCSPSRFLKKERKEIRSPAQCHIKVDAANNHKAITGVVTSFYPGAIICAEPDVRSEMLWGFSGFPLQHANYGVIPKLYLHNPRCLWYHCNTEEHRSSAHTSDSDGTVAKKFTETEAKGGPTVYFKEILQIQRNSLLIANCDAD